MANTLSQHFSFKKLIKFVYPAVFMMVFTSIYGVVDGIFVSNFAGETAFKAVNLIMPVLMGFASFGFMIGAGGSALISKTLGEGDVKRARGIFSMLVYATVILGAVMTVVGIFTLRPLAVALRAEKEGLLNECLLYGFVNMCGITLFMLQNVFQSFFALAEKPKLGLAVIIGAGVTNAVLDAVFIAGFKLGLLGAALATVLGQAVGGIVPVLYFTFNRKGLLYLCKPLIKIMPFLKTCANGSSEMMTQLSLSVVNILYNYQLMSFAGSDGVAAYGVIMYVSFIFCSIFIGYSVGVTPIIGYNFGAGNKGELNNVLKKSLIMIAVSSAIMVALSMSLNYPLAYVFVRNNATLFAMTRRGFYIFACIFAVMGFNIFGSAFFTALNNGLISAIISFLRTLLFQVVCVMCLPLLWGLDGVWASNVFAELTALVVTFTLFMCFRKKYGYFIKIEPEKQLPESEEKGEN
ncbi:MAG: MATE family efflux transporter [Clostridiales bacterium]|nr:MATE family efflux transporter [Clostridiales bacterium]